MHSPKVRVPLGDDPRTEKGRKGETMKVNKAYQVKVGKKFVSSPTNRLTNNREFSAVFEDLRQAEIVAKKHGGTVISYRG